MQIILIFQAVQAFSLIVIAFSLHSIWKKIEWEPNVTLPQKEDFKTDKEPTGAKWQTSEKKFRAKVYEE